MSEQAIFQLEYLPLRFTFLSAGVARLPDFLGSTLRGSIGGVLYQDKELYQFLYKNRSLSGGEADVVNPYMICPPLTESREYEKGKELRFEMILFGEAIGYAGLLVKAIMQQRDIGLGASKYPFTPIKAVHALDNRIVWKDGGLCDVAFREVCLPQRMLEDVRQIRVSLLSPLRIRRNGKLLEEIDFKTLIRNITKRVDALTARYGGWVSSEEAERVRQLAEAVRTTEYRLQRLDMQRYSRRLAEKMDFDGMVGRAAFEGDLSCFVPWIGAAEVLHFGRNTTFGMGRIEAEFF